MSSRTILCNINALITHTYVLPFMLFVMGVQTTSLDQIISNYISSGLCINAMHISTLVVLL